MARVVQEKVREHVIGVKKSSGSDLFVHHVFVKLSFEPADFVLMSSTDSEQLYENIQD